MKKRAHLFREALVALAGAPALSIRGAHVPRTINSKKMLESLLGQKGKSMGRMYALKINEDIATARANRKGRQRTPLSKESSKLGTPTSKFEIISHLLFFLLLTNVIIQLLCVCVFTDCTSDCQLFSRNQPSQGWRLNESPRRSVFVPWWCQRRFKLCSFPSILQRRHCWQCFLNCVCVSSPSQ